MPVFVLSRLAVDRNYHSCSLGGVLVCDGHAGRQARKVVGDQIGKRKSVAAKDRTICEAVLLMAFEALHQGHLRSHQ